MAESQSTPQQNAANTRSDNTGATPSRNKGKRKMMLLLLLAVVVVFLIAFGLYYWLHGRFYESTNDGYVTGNLVHITPQFAGTVTNPIADDDGNYIKQGQLLVRLDPSDTIVAQEIAEVNLARLVRQVRGMYSNVDNYKMMVASRKVELQGARADYQRRANLARDALTSAETLLTLAQQ